MSLACKDAFTELGAQSKKPEDPGSDPGIYMKAGRWVGGVSNPGLGGGDSRFLVLKSQPVSLAGKLYTQ